MSTSREERPTTGSGPEQPPVAVGAGSSPANGQPRLAMLGEIFDLALLAAGEIWPTPSMALGRLFERGVDFLDRAGTLARISGRASADLLNSLNTCREDLFLVEALYLVTRHAAFTATEAGAALETTWLALAERHLEIRSEIVDRRREEEQLKRQLTSLGGTTVPLPEHDDLPMTDGNRPRKSRGMFDHLFDGARIIEVDLGVDPLAWAAADRVIAARGWADEWGDHARLLVLTHGLSLALREREADAVNVNDDAAVRTANDTTRKRLMGLEGRYSTLRRRLFELRHNNRILQWRITALEVEAQGMRSRLDQFLLDRDRLEQEIAERRAAGAVPRPDGSTPDGSVWRRLGRLFGRRD